MKNPNGPKKWRDLLTGAGIGVSGVILIIAILLIVTNNFGGVQFPNGTTITSGNNATTSQIIGGFLAFCSIIFFGLAFLPETFSGKIPKLRNWIGLIIVSVFLMVLSVGILFYYNPKPEGFKAANTPTISSTPTIGQNLTPYFTNKVDFTPTIPTVTQPVPTQLPTNTPNPPTDTTLAPTNTIVPPTNTPNPPTATPVPTKIPNLLFEDNFEPEPRNDWTPLQGEWGTVQGLFKPLGTNSGSIAVGDPKWGEERIEITMSSDAEFDLFLYLQGEKFGNSLFTASNYTQIRVNFFQNACNPVLCNDKTETKCTITGINYQVNGNSMGYDDFRTTYCDPTRNQTSNLLVIEARNRTVTILDPNGNKAYNTTILSGFTSGRFGLELIRGGFSNIKVIKL